MTQMVTKASSFSAYKTIFFPTRVITPRTIGWGPLVLCHPFLLSRFNNWCLLGVLMDTYYSATAAPAVALPRKSPGRAEQVPGHSRANAEGPGMGSVRGCCGLVLEMSWCCSVLQGGTGRMDVIPGSCSTTSFCSCAVHNQKPCKLRQSWTGGCF